MSNKFQKTKVGKTASVFVSLTTLLWLSGAAALMPTVAAAQTVEEINAQIQTLLAQIAQLQAQLATLQGTGAVCGYTFAVDLKQGSTGADVKNLQIVLNSDAATQVAASGVGSSGNETTYFGSLTKAAVVKFQNKYAADILTPLGLTAGTGYVGASTRAKLNALFGTCAPTKAACEDGIDNDNDGKIDYPADTDCTSASDTSEAVIPAGTGLTVSSTAQPAASIAVENAARLPFTKITLTAGSDGDVVVNAINVERTGLAVDSNFSGIILLDEDGLQLGIAKTLNSNHQATVGEAFTVKAGQSRTMTIAANMAAILDSYAGQVAFLSVTGINTSATVTGTLPITGAGHTINATLTIGSVTATRGPLDPNGSVSKEVGTTGYTFSSVKYTAGSQEKVRIKSIRWNQSGSAATSDLKNVKTYVEGTGYDVTISSDGKYYTSTFGTGIVVDKGNSAEISIKGDIEGGSDRTIDLDIYKNTDVYITGETYGYGITVSATNGDACDTSTSGTCDDSDFMSTANPWYDASQVTVSKGTITVSKATSVAAQNVAINVSNQPIGGFDVEVKGEAVSVAQIDIYLDVTGTGDAQDITSASLFDANGNVVAGPGDASSGRLRFTDTVTFPIGKNTYTLKGKYGTDFATNDTVKASTTPGTDWTSATGQVTGNTITVSPSTALTGNTMTVKAAATAISVSATPVAQTVVAGAQKFVFANYVFDATASGEDIKFSSVPLAFVNGGTATYITGCQLYDGSSILNTGSNVVNPTATGNSTFTFDAGLTISKGTVKTIAFKCDIAGNATTSSYFRWGMPAYTSFSATGLTSGQSASLSGAANAGQQMTIAANGTLTVALDSSSPSYALTAGGTTGNTLSALKLHAANEPITLQKVAMQLSHAASNSPQDLVKVTLWDGATQVGEAIFTDTDYATSTLTTTVTVPKDGDKIITIKGDLAAIGTSEAGTSGHRIAVDYDGDDSTGTQGIGQSSGATISQGSSSDTASDGVRTFRSYPTLAKLSAPTLTLSNGQMTLYRFKVTANSAGDIGLYKFTFTMSTTTGTTAGLQVDTLNVYGYTDSGFSSPISGVSSGGAFRSTGLDITEGVINWVDSSTQIELYPLTSADASTTVQVPAGQSRYLELVATISGATAGASVSTQLQGDGAYPGLSSTSTSAGWFMDYYDAIEYDDTHNAADHDDFIWSPNSTTTSGLSTSQDWINGYGISGLPSTNMSAEVLSK